MAAEIIDGKQIAERVRSEVTRTVRELAGRGTVPGLAVVLVGEDPASASYVRGKQRACGEVGIHSRDIKLPETVSEQTLLDVVSELNVDPTVHGILVQLPLPRHIDERKVIHRISPDKDVDGFHPVSVGRLVIGEPGFRPCTPYGIMKMLEYEKVQTDGAHVVIVGRSNLVGKPLANMLIQKGAGANATVTLCHTGTRDLGHHTRQADILVAAAGRPEFITGDMVAEGAVVIDVGMNRVEDASRKRGYRLTGDVDFSAARERASKITPVPGGVGPMTIAMLLQNTVESAIRSGNG